MACCIAGRISAQRVEHVFGGVIALRLEREQIVAQVAHRAFDPGHIDGERAAGTRDESALMRAPEPIRW
jgi:hypothetical protein